MDVEGYTVLPRPPLPMQAVVLDGFATVIQRLLLPDQNVTRAETCRFRPGALTPEAKVR